MNDWDTLDGLLEEIKKYHKAVAMRDNAAKMITDFRRQKRFKDLSRACKTWVNRSQQVNIAEAKLLKVIRDL